MKRNIYSYSKLWMIFFVLMGAACTNQVEDAIPVSGQPIEFSVQSDWKEIPNTRLNEGIKKFKAGDKIQIFGFHKSSSGVEMKFMYRVGEPARGQIVTFDGTNWNYSPKRFWPKEGTLDFYASYPDYSVLNEGDKMTYVQPDFNPLGVDLLWGLATNRDCATACKETVQIWMVHALARVNIFFDSSLGDIKQAKVSAYKAGDFSNAADNGVPLWNVDKTSDKNIQEATISPYENQQTIGDATVFILPDKITGLKLTPLAGKEIDVSYKIQNLTFEAGKEYNLTISKGVQKKNTNSRSIAMSVRCVSE
jgi:hypothetical protein